MPKKTRKEKLLAQRRRLTSPSHISQSTPLPVSEHLTDTVSAFQFHAQQTKKAQIKETDDKVELTAIKSDLRRTLFLAFIAISVELTIYWLLRGK